VVVVVLSLCVRVCVCVCVCVCAYLAILKLEDQLHLVALDLLLDDLGGDPAVGDVWLPCPGAVLVDVCHGSGRVPRPLVVVVGGVTVTLRVQQEALLSKGYTSSSSLNPMRPGEVLSVQDRRSHRHSHKCMTRRIVCVLRPRAMLRRCRPSGHGLSAGTLVSTLSHRQHVPLRARAKTQGLANHHTSPPKPTQNTWSRA
jgi:hypothetical protein